MEWRKLDAPPEPVARIVLADYKYFVVETAQGNLYDCCWQAIAPEELPDPPPQPDPIPDGARITEPPGTVVGSLDVAYVEGGEMSPSYVRYVLLDDGSIWEWKLWGADVSLSVIPLLLYPGGGAFAGLILGVIFGTAGLVWWDWRSRRRNPPA